MSSLLKGWNTLQQRRLISGELPTGEKNRQETQWLNELNRLNPR
jgi:hypothetical protein